MSADGLHVGSSAAMLDYLPKRDAGEGKRSQVRRRRGADEPPGAGSTERNVPTWPTDAAALRAMILRVGKGGLGMDDQCVLGWAATMRAAPHHFD
jgi:hypothetical protein